MKKRKITALLAMVLCVAMLLGACSKDPKEPGTPNPPDDPDTLDPPDTPDVSETAVTLAGKMDEDKWEVDGDIDFKGDYILFPNFFYGDYAAAMLKESQRDATYKFTVQLNKIATDLDPSSTWWDSEFLIQVRSSVAGPSWRDDGSQTGYCVTSWGDMSEVAIGRSGYDDLFGTFPWNVNDGKPHEIEFSTKNNEDNTAVTVKLVVDGKTIFEGVDDGSKFKKEGRPTLYPEAGNLTIRCKYLEAVISDAPVEGIGGSDPVEPNPPAPGPDQPDPAASGYNPEPVTGAPTEVVNLGDCLDAGLWEDDGGEVWVESKGIEFDTLGSGNFAAARLKEQRQNATYKFNLKLDVPEDAADNWYDTELLICARSAVADKGWADGTQTGYTISAWGDMSEGYIGRAGKDDLVKFYWPLNDGQEHAIEFTAENNADNTAVNLKLVVDGETVCEFTDDGSVVRDDRPNLYPGAGGLTIRCLNLGAVVTGYDASSAPASTTAEPVSVNVSDAMDAARWETDGSVTIEGGALTADGIGSVAAARLTDSYADVTYRFKVKLDIPEDAAEKWYDTEFLLVARSAIAGKGWADGAQTGYTITAWGDMSEVYIGRAGKDDLSGKCLWPLNDGQEHEIEFTVTNNADGTSVNLKLVVDGETVYEGVDDGSQVKEGRPALYPDAGGFTVCCTNVTATIR